MNIAKNIITMLMVSTAMLVIVMVFWTSPSFAILYLDVVDKTERNIFITKTLEEKLTHHYQRYADKYQFTAHENTLTIKITNIAPSAIEVVGDDVNQMLGYFSGQYHFPPSKKVKTESDKKTIIFTITF